MYTIDQIRAIQFTKKMGGYKSDEVDEFIDGVVETVTTLTNEKNEEHAKLETLASKLVEYRSQEENMHATFMSAQRSAEVITRDAQEKSSALLAESQAQSTALLQDAQQQSEAMIADATQRSQAMLTDAEQRSTSMLAEAEQKSQQITSEAQNQADTLLSEVNAAIKAEREQLAIEKAEAEKVVNKLKNEASDFKKELFALYKEHVQLVDKIPTDRADQKVSDSYEIPSVSLEDASFDESSLDISTPVDEYAFDSTLETPTIEPEDTYSIETPTSDVSYEIPATEEVSAADLPTEETSYEIPYEQDLTSDISTEIPTGDYSAVAEEPSYEAPSYEIPSYEIPTDDGLSSEMPSFDLPATEEATQESVSYEIPSSDSVDSVSYEIPTEEQPLSDIAYEIPTTEDTVAATEGVSGDFAFSTEEAGADVDFGVPSFGSDADSGDIDFGTPSFDFGTTDGDIDFGTPSFGADDFGAPKTDAELWPENDTIPTVNDDLQFGDGFETPTDLNNPFGRNNG